MTWWEKRDIGPLMAQGSIWGPLMTQWGNERPLCSDGKLGTPNELMGKLGALDHKFVSIGLIRLHCTLSNLWAPNFNWKILHFMQAETEYTGPRYPIVRLILQRLCDDWQFLLWVLGPQWSQIFCHLLWLMRIYRLGATGRPRPGIWKVFSFLIFPFFSFFFLFSSLLFSFSLSLGAHLAPGPMDFVHPCHPVATPLL